MSAAADGGGIAIIGMACRFPGADTPAAFWHNLCQGVESITFFSDAELLAAGVDTALLQDPSYVKAAPILHDVDQFDAAFFAYSPKEAALMDPQQRLFLEVAWEACEDAGYYPEAYPGVIGIVAGAGGLVTSYYVAHPNHPELAGQTGGLQHIGNDKDFLSTRVAYKLNLTGPSLTVQTACSTSLVAVHLACQSLMSGECDMVLAGAATVRVPHIRGYRVENGNINSPDGHCRAFDAAAQGTIFGSGVGAVLLKKVEDALADGDPIYAVIKGTAINNDGAMKVSYTASSVAGQARAMVEALTLADVSAATIGYVECHGTGTIVGDPLEIQALTRSFGLHTTRQGFCAVGSVKTNVGHLEQTAGIVGLMKTALALHHKTLPASLHFASPNAKIDFAKSPFYVNTTLQAWPADTTPRRAAINSLGLGGTNAFAVLEEAPEIPSELFPNERSLHLFSLSAKSEAGLVAYAERCHAFLDIHPDANIADICYTANVSRTYFPYRFAVTVDSKAALQQQLAVVAAGVSGVEVSNRRTQKKPVVFLFTGQGAQYPGMAAELYRTQPTFRDALQQCDAGLRPYLNPTLLDVLFAQGEDALLLHETAYTQPALFAVEYALAQLWQAWGLAPDAVMGHSIGELVAACIAGVFDLKDALELVAQRGQLMQGLPKQGTMAVVFAAEAVVQEALAPHPGRVSIAAVNSPQNTVISGEREAVAQILERLRAQDVTSQALAVSHAFHSPLMDPILDAFAIVASQIECKEPHIPLLSNLTGKPMEQAPDSRYWRDHVRRAVRFAEGMQTLHELGYDLFVEIGPGHTLLSMGQQCLPGAKATWLASLSRQTTDWRTLLESVRHLYLQGFPINWPMVAEGFSRRRIPLPTYPFQRQHYWLDPAPCRDTDVRRRTTPSDHPLLGARLRSGLKDVQFEAIYSLEQLPYLAHHRIYGMVVLPTTAGLEAVTAAGRAYFGSSDLVLENLVYYEAMVLPKDEARLVQLILTPQGPSRASFQLLSTGQLLSTASPGEDDWRRHMSGGLRLATAAGPPAAGAPPVFSAIEIQARCAKTIPPERYYPAVRDMGLDYGPAFQGIQQLWQGDGEALSAVRLPPHVSTDPYGLHPAFLDACLHIYPVLAREYGDFSLPSAPHRQTYLPIGIERFRIYQDPTTEAWVHATLRDHSADTHTLMMDIRLYDTAANIIAVFEGLSVRQLSPDIIRPAVAGTFTDWLYHLRWDEQLLSEPHPITAAESTDEPVAVCRTTGSEAPSSWLLFVDRGGVGETLAQLLEQRGDQCHVVLPDTTFTHHGPKRWGLNPARAADFQQLVRDVGESEPLPCRGVVYLWGLDLTAMQEMTLERLTVSEAVGTGGALFLIQALAAARSLGTFAPRLWLVTRNAQSLGLDVGPGTPSIEAAQAPLWGLGRVVPLEYPQMWGGLIDLPPLEPARVRHDADALVAEMLRSDREDQVALRRENRYVARLARLPQDSVPQDAMIFRPDVTYLITGGLGTLGLKVAQWLVEQQGVRSLVLTGRRGAQGAAQDAVKALEARGAQVHVMQADITMEADVQRVMEEMQQHLPPLKGVIHCAGILDDGVLSQLDWQKFTRVTAPKIRGGWLLHHYTQHMELDIFVLFSSILSLTGSAGQANYTAGNTFLDALVGYRRALGLAAMAINWGPWDEAGLATASGSRGEAVWRARGTQYIPPQDGMHVFDHVMHRNVDHAAATITDWSIYLEQFPVCPPLYRELAREARPGRKPKRSGGIPDVQARLRQVPQRQHRPILVAFLRQEVLDVLGLESDLDLRQPLNELGLDSLMSVNLVNRLEAALEISVPMVKLIQGPSLDQLVDDLFPHLADMTDAVMPPETPLASDSGIPADVGFAPDATLPHAWVGTSEIAGNGWLVFPKPRPAAAVRLFCFPFAGGGAATYRSWADTVDPSIEIVAIEPPGRASRIHDSPISSLASFLDALIPALLPYLDKPFAFFGHCLGGLILFETARQLLNHHQLSPQHLFVSGARAPHRLLREGLFEENLLADLLKYDNFDPFLLTHEQPDDVFAEILRRFNIGATEELLADPELRRLLLPAIRAEFDMTFHYRFTPELPWDVPITCFIGIDDTYVTHDDALAWGQYTKVAFRLYMREGAHFIVVDDKSFILETVSRELIASAVAR